MAKDNVCENAFTDNWCEHELVWHFQNEILAIFIKIENNNTFYLNMVAHSYVFKKVHILQRIHVPKEFY